MRVPRVFIEEWLPAQAIGVECARERSTGQQPPDKRLHVWWARRPLTISRAAVLASLLPADFDRRTFERLLGFGKPSEEIVRIRALMDAGAVVPGGFGYGRAFRNGLVPADLNAAHMAAHDLWGALPVVIDPMAGGGSIPLEAARLGVRSLANELNPVACSVLEATVDYPLRLAASLAARARRRGDEWIRRIEARLAPYYPKERVALVHAYIFARTVPCPDTGFPTPLVPDWSLLRPAGGQHIVAEPVVDRGRGTWTIRVRRVGRDAGELRTPPAPTYKGGKGASLFSGGPITGDYIKAQAQLGRMGSALYAVATKATTKLEFRPAEETDLRALADAEKELARLRPGWERDGIIPTELYPDVTTDERPRTYGMPRWADLFAPRQLLAMGVLVEELRALRPEIIRAEGEEMGEAIVHLLACVVDKIANHDCILSKWECTRGVIKGKFDRHDYAFRVTFAEMAPCVSGGGLAWAIDNVLEAYENLAELPRAENARPVETTQGSATSLAHLDDGAVAAVVVDPPYADNVQYSELADFFYVWLKRTQGHRRPEWFGTYLCDHDQEAVVNVARHRDGAGSVADARAEAHALYEDLMTQTFREARRVLRDDGVLTVMFTHKQQSAWAALFGSLIEAGFTITATWPVQTESQHSLHQANKNAAQSTVLLVARKRPAGAGRAYYDEELRQRMRGAARARAAQLQSDGLNPVDQMVGAFGPAMQPFSAFDEVHNDLGERVGVDAAIQLAADAVIEWRVEQLAARGLPGVDPESRFTLLCWDVLQAAQFRFNEAMLLGRAVGMDVGRLVDAGLVAKSGENIILLPAQDRRRDRPVGADATLFGPEPSRRRSRGGPRQVHPGDAAFATAIDMCHALALRYDDAGRGDNGIGEARSLALQMGWRAGSPCDLLMDALLRAAPHAVRFAGKRGKRTAADRYPEFRAWHAMYPALFGGQVEEWKEPPEQATLFAESDELDESDASDWSDGSDDDE